MMGTLLVGGIVLLFIVVSVYAITHGDNSVLHGCNGNCASCGACAVKKEPEKK
ncbi:MAG: FeoB-associated Cys-rich membrane protein [Acidaminococcus sp.]|nr:FeoB-associated Cys-rich membrane protein [Acidaminococcus sp.]MCI2100555.1 FeoB-associated Cys-rich membrane protein [Acidaminococcus sp.]MCI2114900.1 FeoB-associated Cys-rich membrane protein [Acidaminococcus sp.]MCI2116978.1 FeoB-associated Cys-rich membrane protein [Acidaminococcus sp.]